jgi:tRNA (guanine-N7-)-methyltransferase
MRLRNIKGAQDIISKSKYLIIDSSNYKGNFNKLFNNNNPIEIEIGMGKGDFIIEKAKTNPNINFIGIEKYASVLVYAIKKLENIDLPNLKIINIDASLINETFSNEIDKIYLNFSDPWPKKKHANRRLTSHIFLDKYKYIFKKDFIIEMKTDNQKLFEYSICSLSNNGYILKYVTFDLYNDDLNGNVKTEYEKKFVSKGMNIHKLVAVQRVDC